MRTKQEVQVGLIDRNGCDFGDVKPMTFFEFDGELCMKLPTACDSESATHFNAIMFSEVEATSTIFLADDESVRVLDGVHIMEIKA